MVDQKKTQNDRFAEAMSKAQEGDKRAYYDLLQELSIITKRVLSSRVNNDSDIEDISQEILISVDKAKASYDPKRLFMPWFMAILNFRLNNYFRKIYRNSEFQEVNYEEISEFISDDSQLDVTNLGIRAEYLEEALMGLPEKQRTIIKMMYVEGFTVKEVAEKLDMSVSAVKVTAHRVYKKLKIEITS
ncbi:MAG: RNA polymerase sigma factor, partial [Rickettsiales bacterium]|nr:RNA polymerase sigma factor [Rickettsiales bacterium]